MPNTTKLQKTDSRAEEMFKTLRQEILTLKLAPGTPINELSLATRFDLSRVPVREALKRLAGSGLVVMNKNKASIVSPLNIGDFPKYIEALDLLQRVVTVLAAKLRTDEDLDNIKYAMDEFAQAIKNPDDYLLVTETNKQFHIAIAKAGKNPYLTKQYVELLEEGQRFLAVQFDFYKKSDSGKFPMDDHPLIYQAIENQNVEQAEKLAHLHTEYFRDRFLGTLELNFLEDFNIGSARA